MTGNALHAPAHNLSTGLSLDITPALGFLDQTHWEIALALINCFCDFHTNFLGTLTILALLARCTDFPVPVSNFGQAFIARLLTDSIFHQRVATRAFLTHHPLRLLIFYAKKLTVAAGILNFGS